MPPEPAPSRGIALVFGRFIIRTASMLVPPRRRSEWLEDWCAELWRLLQAAERDPRNYPNPELSAIRFSFGSIPHACWEFKEGFHMEGTFDDIRQAVRSLVASPGPTLVAVLTITLGLAGTTSIFTLVNSIIFRSPQGIARPVELVQIGRGSSPGDFDNVSYPLFQDYRSRNDVFSGVAAYAYRVLLLGAGDQSSRVTSQAVSENFFDVLGAPPALGRGFAADEADQDVALISHRLWRSRYGLDPSVLGQDIRLSGRTFRVVGVTEEGFSGVDVARQPTDVWIPIEAYARTREPVAASGLVSVSMNWLWVVARLEPGVNFELARESMTVLRAELDREYGVPRPQSILLVEGVGLRPAERAEAGRFSGLLLGVVGMVLVIACTNLASVFLARSIRRRGELGIRMALGASRGRVIRLLLVESLVISMLGGAIAFVASIWSAPRLVGILPASIAVDLRPDLNVFLFGFSVALASGIAFGILPALISSRVDLASVLGRLSAARGSSRSGLRSLLVTAQIALAFVLLVSAGLLGRSLANARSADPGFDSDVLVLSLAPGSIGDLSAGEVSTLYDETVRRVRGLAGVNHAALADSIPIAEFPSRYSVLPPGSEAGDVAALIPLPANTVGPGYFETLGIPVLSGRAFTRSDQEDELGRVAVINEALARRFWGAEDPIGRQIRFGGPRPPAEVIGVVGNSKTISLRGEPRPYLYLPFLTNDPTGMRLHVKTEGDPLRMREGITSAIEAVSPLLPVYGVSTLSAAIGDSFGETRTMAWLISGSGALAFLLACVGLYGTVSYSTAQRRREFGIRIAVGAGPTAIALLVLRGAAVVVVAGLISGAVLSFGATNLIASMLFGVSRGDVFVLVGIVLLLGVISMAASCIPAVRAMRADPVVSLVEE